MYRSEDCNENAIREMLGLQVFKRWKRTHLDFIIRRESEKPFLAATLAVCQR